MKPAALFTPRAVLVLASTCCAAAASAQPSPATSPSLHLDHPAYESLRAVQALGLGRVTMQGQHPLSVERLNAALRAANVELTQLRLSAALPELSSSRRALLARRIGAAEAQLHATAVTDAAPGVAPPRRWWVNRTGTAIYLIDSAERPIHDNGLSAVDAGINPLVHNRRGLRLEDGANITAFAEAGAQLGKRVLLLVRPRLLSVRRRSDESWDHRPTLDAAYARFRLSNALIDVGRDHTAWMQGENAGLLLSRNAPSLDMVRISSDTLFMLPWLLSRMGPSAFTGFIASLGGDQNFPGSRLLAYKLSSRPGSDVEMGVAVFVHGGGEGAPPAPFHERLLDYLPLIDVFIGDRDFEFSNKIVAADMRIRIPGTAATEMYAELAIDDFDVHRLRSIFWTDDAAHLLGISLPLRTPGGAGLSAEYHHTGRRFWRHAQFVSGVTRRRFILGNALGPDANAGYVTLNAPAGNGALRLALAAEWRSGDMYGAPGNLPTIRLESRPTERRLRAVAAWTIPGARAARKLQLEAGYEHVRDSGFEAGSMAHNTLLALRIGG